MITLKFLLSCRKNVYRLVAVIIGDFTTFESLLALLHHTKTSEFIEVV